MTFRDASEEKHECKRGFEGEGVIRLEVYDNVERRDFRYVHDKFAKRAFLRSIDRN